MFKPRHSDVNLCKNTLFEGYACHSSTNCVQLGVACGWLSYVYGLKCKLLFDVYELTSISVLRTHQRYCLGDDCSEASR